VIRICGKESWRRKIMVGFGLIAACSPAVLATNPITGVARNRTRGEFAAGDEVILFRLDQGMQQEARTSTDSQGSFTLKVQHPDKLHLVRVVHQGVNYDQQARSGDAVSIDVFDAAGKVRGVRGSIEIVRAQSIGNRLHVSDMVEIRNDFSPPLTQAGERTFEVYLPAHAKIDSVLAAGSGKIVVLISATPVPGEPGHYAVNFPLRPGSTKFAFNYDVPYDGHAAFRPKLVFPLQQLAVMIPPTMRFRSWSPAFQLLSTGDNDYQVHATRPLRAGEGPQFEVSGTGALPPINAGAQSKAHPQTGVVSDSVIPPPVSPGSPAPVAAQSGLAPASSTSLQWIFGATTVIVAGGCGFLIWRTRHRAGQGMDTKIASRTL
jgi:hypothetical protein